MIHRILGVAVAVGLATAAVPAGAADVAEGEKVFRKCKACHTIEQGDKNKIGPNLYGVIGRDAASVEDFKYSKAMAESNITWDEDTLAQYLADPRGFVKGNKMAFPGLNDEEDIENVIAYLKEAGG